MASQGSSSSPSSSGSTLRPNTASSSSSRPVNGTDLKKPLVDTQFRADNSIPTSDYHSRLRPLITTMGWDLNAIIESSPNFHHVRRVHCTSPAAKPDAIIPEFEENGTPLIISGWNRHPKWPRGIFTVDWLQEHGDQNPTVRNVHNWTDVKMPIGDFIDKMRHSNVYASRDEQERLYGKDGVCPEEWTKWLTESGAIPEQLLFHGSNDFLRFLPEKTSVQTLMCYMGIGDTFTPFHKDLCASSGQNLMCYTEHSGSAFWFMTKSSSALQVATYFHQLGQELDLESHVVTIEELAKAPFDVYIAEQQLGDLVLVPPRCCHQVVNKGGITIKTSWSRMSLTGLHTALWHELPIYHRVCRQETYKVKSSIFHALQHYTRTLANSPDQAENAMHLNDAITLQRLINLFDDILASEFSMSRDSMPHVSQPGFSHEDNLHCDFCGADIFQSFFECVPCRTVSPEDPLSNIPIGDGLIICPPCYVEGRTCRCGVMEPVQCRPYSDLLQVRDQAVMVVQRMDSGYSNAFGYLSEQPSQLLSGDQVNIFEVACKLSQHRWSESKASKSCRARRGDSHQVPASAGIYCKPCHGSKCYTHLLETDCIHSATIPSDHHDGNTNWHLFHRQGAKRYQESWQSVTEDEANGSRPNSSLRLIYLAKTFKTCRAIVPENTEHGWYDRYAPTTLNPIVDTPAKVLVGLADESEKDELGDVEQHKPPSRQLSRSPTADSLVSDIVGTLSISARKELIHSPTITTRKARSPGQLQSDSPAHLGSPSVLQEHPTVASSLHLMDDSGDLSDLTDLLTEDDSSPRNLSGIVSTPQIAGTQSLSPSSAVATGAFPGSRSFARVKSKSRVKFAGVEIQRPHWYNRSNTQAQPPSKLKRKRAQSTEVLTEDEIPTPNEPVASIRSSDKGKRKMSRGAASRLPRPNARARPSATILGPVPQANGLASALNQTFMQNSVGHRITSPLNNSVSSTSDTVDVPQSKPQYIDAYTQTELRFTRCKSVVPLATDPFRSIERLQRENDELRAQLDLWKGESERYREGLHEYRKRYILQNSPPYLPSVGGPSTNISYEHHDATHAGPRVQNTAANNSIGHVSEPDYPPVETHSLPTPSSAESPGQLPEVAPLLLPSPIRRRPQTEPRSVQRAHFERRGDHVPYHYRSRRLRYGNDPPETPTNGGKWRTKARRDQVLSSHTRQPLGSPVQQSTSSSVGSGSLNSTVMVDEEKGEELAGDKASS